MRSPKAAAATPPRERPMPRLVSDAGASGEEMLLAGTAEVVEPMAAGIESGSRTEGGVNTVGGPGVACDGGWTAPGASVLL